MDRFQNLRRQREYRDLLPTALWFGGSVDGRRDARGGALTNVHRPSRGPSSAVVREPTTLPPTPPAQLAFGKRCLGVRPPPSTALQRMQQITRVHAAYFTTRLRGTPSQATLHRVPCDHALPWR
jgi:hypothetical protein